MKFPGNDGLRSPISLIAVVFFVSVSLGWSASDSTPIAPAPGLTSPQTVGIPTTEAPRTVTFAADTAISRLTSNPTMPPTPRTAAIASGDFNEDGAMDLVVANGMVAPSASFTATVLFGDGNGSFGNPLELYISSDPKGLAVLDIDGDNHLDIITVGSLPDNTISVWLGNGDGTFRGRDKDLPFESPIGIGPSAMVVADFNGDGIPDVVTTIPATGTIRVQLGRGDGLFGEPAEFIARLDDQLVPRAIVACDYDHDGNLDVAVLNVFGARGSLTLLAGDGMGGFSSVPRIIPVSATLHSLVAADLDGDNFIDLIIGATDNDGRGDAGRIKLFFGLADAPYFEERPSLLVPLSPVNIVVRDLNEDNNLDLVVALSQSQNVGLYFGNGRGDFSPGAMVPSGGSPHSLVVDVLNAGALLDIAAATTPVPSTDRGHISLLRGISLPDPPYYGLFLPPSPDVEQDFRPPSTRSQPRAVVTADFDQDGFLDLAVANYNRNTVSILTGNSQGNFKARQAMAIRCPSADCDPGPHALALGDFNNDNVIDLVVLNRFGDFVNFFGGTAEGVFDPEQQQITSFSGSGLRQPSAFAAGDFNRDGNLDLAIVTERSGDLILLDGLGDGTFKVRVVRVDDELDLTSASAILAQDLDGDDILDLAVLLDPLTGDGQLRILKGKGDGTFCRAGKNAGRLCCVVGDGCSAIDVNLLQGQSGPRGLARAFFSSDGSDYLAVVNSASRSLSIFAAADNGYSLVQTSPLASDPSAVLAVDLDQSGAPAFVVVNQASNSVTVFTRNDDKFLPQWVDWGVGRAPWAITAGDFNQDGLTDLAVVNYLGDTVTILLNQTALSSR